MIGKNEILKMNIDEGVIKHIIEHSLTQNFHRRDNLRTRHPNVQFDCLLRGYIGEYVIRQWFQENGITFSESTYDYDEQGNIDIDLLYEKNNKQWSLEIKTSLVPDNYARFEDEPLKRITKIIDDNRVDIKLIQRNNESIEQFKGDIHIQIYYSDFRRKKDGFLSALPIVSTNQTVDEIYNLLAANTYMNRTFFVGWIDKPTLIQQINNKPLNNQRWTYPGAKRYFWTCKIQSEAKEPIELINYIKGLE